jgi:hypothetical protein
LVLKSLDSKSSFTLPQEALGFPWSVYARTAAHCMHLHRRALHAPPPHRISIHLHTPPHTSRRISTHLHAPMRPPCARQGRVPGRHVSRSRTPRIGRSAHAGAVREEGRGHRMRAVPAEWRAVSGCEAMSRGIRASPVLRADLQEPPNS